MFPAALFRAARSFALVNSKTASFRRAIGRSQKETVSSEETAICVKTLGL